LFGDDFTRLLEKTSQNAHGSGGEIEHLLAAQNRTANQIDAEVPEGDNARMGRIGALGCRAETLRRIPHSTPLSATSRESLRDSTRPAALQS
jgi:hypothetical protein